MVKVTNDIIFMIVAGSAVNKKRAAPTFVQSQAESLRRGGQEVFWAVMDDRTSVGGIIRNMTRLRGDVRKVKPSLIHAQYGSMTAAVAAAIKGDVPLVVSFCGDDLLGTPIPGIKWRLRSRVSRWLGLWAAVRAAAIIVKSANLLQVLPKMLRKKARVLPNGVNIDWFMPMDQCECRRKLGWPNDSRVVLFNVSQNEDQFRKNPELAKQSMDALAQRVPNVSLRVISSATPEEVRLAMNAADCLLVTSLQEGSPNIVKEAMACNLPIVSVPCGDVKERLKLVKPGGIASYNPDALAEAIKEVLNANRRSNGRDELIRQHLTTEHIQEQLSLVYDRVKRTAAITNV